MPALDLLLIGLLALSSAGLLMPGKAYLAAGGLAATALLVAVDRLYSLHWQALPCAGVAMALLATFLIAARSGRGPSRPLSGGRMLVAALFLAGTALASLPYYLFPVFTFPAPSGPFPVGVRDFELVDESRSGVMFDAREEARRLTIRAWYPASKEAAGTGRRYFKQQEVWVQGRSAAENAGYESHAFLHFFDVRTNGVEGAPVARLPDGFPLVVFNHGFLLYPSQNTCLMEHLASHGFVVLSIGHPYDTATIEFEDGEEHVPEPLRVDDEFGAALDRFFGGATHDGRYAALAEYRNAIAGHRLMKSVEAWRADSIFVAEAFADRSLPEQVLDVAAATHARNRAYAGMSFGGATAASACHLDRHCEAAVSLDGVNWDPALFNSDLRSPLLFMQSDWLTHPLFPTQPPDAAFTPMDYAYESWATAGSREDIYRFRIEGAAHMAFTDLVLATQGPSRARAYGTIDPEDAIRVVNDFTLAFLVAHLKAAPVAFPGPQLEAHDSVRSHSASGVAEWWNSRQ